MGSIDEIVALNIDMRMRDLNMTQKKLALLTGLTPAYINKLLKGKKPVSKSSSLPAIAKALHLTESELYQDAQSAAQLEAREIAHKSEVADLKRMSRMVQDQLLETMSDLRAARENAPFGPGPRDPSLSLALSAWRKAKGPGEWRRHLALFFLTGEGSHLDHPSVPEKLKRDLLTGLRFGRKISPRRSAPKK